MSEIDLAAFSIFILLWLGYLGWFVNAYVFVAASALVIIVLVHRQFFSPARDALLADLQATP